MFFRTDQYQGMEIRLRRAAPQKRKWGNENAWVTEPSITQGMMNDKPSTIVYILSVFCSTIFLTAMLVLWIFHLPPIFHSQNLLSFAMFLLFLMIPFDNFFFLAFIQLHHFLPLSFWFVFRMAATAWDSLVRFLWVGSVEGRWIPFCALFNVCNRMFVFWRFITNLKSALNFYETIVYVQIEANFT